MKDIKSLLSKSPVIVDLGCGNRKFPGVIGIDKNVFPEVDIQADLEEGLPFLEDNSVDEIRSNLF